MKPNTRDGGPAFGQVVSLRCVRVDPTGSEEWEPDLAATGGLTVRDYFAAKAMPTILDLNPTEIWNQGNGFGAKIDTAMMTAKAAYCMADAMLKARSLVEESTAEAVLRQIAAIVQRHQSEGGISKHDALGEITSIVQTLPLVLDGGFLAGQGGQP